MHYVLYNIQDYVSVSSRSYILSYLISLIFYYHTYLNFVSVSSRSYILSYYFFCEKDRCPSLDVSVSSRSYILSYGDIYCWNFNSIEFPSPLGVIFSLIKKIDEASWNRILSFRLLSELYSLLFGKN